MKLDKRQRLIAGVSLILLGLALFWLDLEVGLGQAAVFFVVGGTFLALYLATRKYGFLIPGGVMLGLGAGRIGEDSFFAFGESEMLGLGCGFVAIYLIALLYQKKNAWWSLIAGAALIVMGIPRTENVFAFLFRNWPLLIVIAGVLVLLGAFGGRSRGGGADAGG